MDTTMRSLDPPRQLSLWERDVLEAFLAVPFSGSEELKAQLGSVRVAEEYGGDDPTVIFSVAEGAAPPAPVRQRIPIEAEGRDADGATISILLHVIDGFLWELEVYRPDGESVRCVPDARSLVLFSPDHEKQDRGHADRVLGTA